MVHKSVKKNSKKPKYSRRSKVHSKRKVSKTKSRKISKRKISKRKISKRKMRGGMPIIPIVPKEEPQQKKINPILPTVQNASTIYRPSSSYNREQSMLDDAILGANFTTGGITVGGI